MMIAAMMVAAISANAQNEVGQFTLMPKAGINISKVTNSDSKTKVGLVAGVEAEYGIAEKFGLQFGVLYSMQGDKPKVGSGSEKLDYINIPILANFYVAKGFALKIGLQPGFLVSADNKDAFESFNLSMPIGLSYEFKNGITLDLRGTPGLTAINKNSSSDYKLRSDCSTLTIGYKF